MEKCNDGFINPKPNMIHRSAMMGLQTLKRISSFKCNDGFINPKPNTIIKVQ
jgi:hypothetical protein